MDVLLYDIYRKYMIERKNSDSIQEKLKYNRKVKWWRKKHFITFWFNTIKTDENATDMNNIERNLEKKKLQPCYMNYNDNNIMKNKKYYELFHAP